MYSPELLSAGRHTLFDCLLQSMCCLHLLFYMLALLNKCQRICLLQTNLTMMQNGNFTVTGYNPDMANNVTGKTPAEDYILFQNLALPNALPFLPSNGTCSSVQSPNITLAFQCAGSNNISGTGNCCYDTNAAQYQVRQGATFSTLSAQALQPCNASPASARAQVQLCSKAIWSTSCEPQHLRYSNYIHT